MICNNCNQVVDGLMTYGGLVTKPEDVRDGYNWFFCPNCFDKDPSEEGVLITEDPDEARKILNLLVIEIEKRRHNNDR